MKLFESVLKLLAPNDCINCGLEGSVLCDECRLEVFYKMPSRCPHCLKATTSSALCEAAKKVIKCQHIWVASEYDNVAKSMIYDMKLGGIREVAEAAAKLVSDALPYLPRETVIVPIPTTTRHARNRSFDHTRLMARALSAETGLNYTPLLGRIDQSVQARSKLYVRKIQLQDKMYVTDLSLAKDANILLLDDVFTTGSTLAEAARALKEAGASKVDAVVFAQKIR